MKILVVGDCHGKKPELDKEAAEADMILATGDICGDSKRIREAMFQSMENGKDWWDIIGREEAKKAVKESLEEGEEVLHYLNSFDKPVFVVPGNWDWIGEESWRFLSEDKFQELIDGFKNVHNIDRELLGDGNFSYIGYGPCSAPEIPQYEDDKPESEQEMKELKKEYKNTKKELTKLFENAENPVVFLSHNVPHQTSLDRIENAQSPADGRHYGSVIVREVIEEYSPIISVAGHIHEGYGKEKIDNTFAINAGLESHIFIELGSNEVEKAEFFPST